MSNERVDAGGDPGRGARRYVRYRMAFERVRQAQTDGYFLEAIAIVDSLISDRLASRLGFLLQKRPSERLGCGQLCRQLLNEGVEQDRQFRRVVERIGAWAKSRNHALHAVAKALPSEDGQSFGEVIEDGRDVVAVGIEVLREFDELDLASRRRQGARPPATHPGAFSSRSRRGLLNPKSGS